MESGEGSKDGSTDPDRVFTFRWSDNFNLTLVNFLFMEDITFMEDGARAVISFCILSAIPGYMVVPPDYNISLESRVVYHNNVAVEIFTDIDVAFHD